MKLSYSTLGCVNYSLDQALKVVKDFGLDGIELRGLSGHVPNLEIPEFAEDQIAETARKINAVTFPVALDTSIFCDQLPETDEALDEFRNDLRIAVAIGTPYLRVLGNDLKDPENEAEYEHIVYEIRQMCKLAAPKGKTVLLETHGDIDRIERLSKVLDRIGDEPGFGILWDISHSDMFYGNDWLPFYHYIKPLIRHLHVKDHIRDGEILVSQGKGEIPAREIAEKLLEDGYDGYFSLEWERNWHPELGPIEDAIADYLKVMRG